MDGKYEINNQDIWTTWRMVFQNDTISTLMQLAERKEGYAYSWPDEDGTERDLTVLKYNTRELSIDVLLAGDSAADFKAKYDAFKAYIIAAGYFNLDCLALQKRWKLLYQRMAGYKQLDLASARFTLILLDDFPNETFAID